MTNSVPLFWWLAEKGNLIDNLCSCANLSHSGGANHHAPHTGSREPMGQGHEGLHAECNASPGLRGHFALLNNRFNDVT